MSPGGQPPGGGETTDPRPYDEDMKTIAYRGHDGLLHWTVPGQEDRKEAYDS